jgi:competence protein ComGC
MKLNERGSTLVVVLLAILVFSVLGLAVMRNVVGENKRVNSTESDIQRRNLAESGLTYFENSFNEYVSTTNPSEINIDAFLNQFKSDPANNDGFVPVDPNKPDEMRIKADWEDRDNDLLKITSKGKSGENYKTLVGYYKISFDMQIPKMTMPFFTPGKAIDFSKISVLELGLGNIITADLINLKGDSSTYYTVPNDKVLGVNALGPVLGVNLGNNFETMEQNRVIAVREGEILKADVLKSQKGSIVSVDVLKYHDTEPETNVIINGSYTAVSALGLLSLDGYKDIHFLKLAVMGNTIIQQDSKDLEYRLFSTTKPTRLFSFKEGLIVNKSLVIGGSNNVSNLELHGNMLVADNLDINNVKLETGDRSFPEAMYVFGNVTITNACINTSNNSNRDLRLFTSGKITFQGNTNCTNFNGFFYAEKGIENQMSKKVTINGGMIGTNLTPEKITYNPDSEYLKDVKRTYNKLTPKGRSFN